MLVGLEGDDRREGADRQGVRRAGAERARGTRAGRTGTDPAARAPPDRTGPGKTGRRPGQLFRERWHAMSGTTMTDDALDRLAPLADPVRRSLYAFVVAQPNAVDRDARRGRRRGRAGRSPRSTSTGSPRPASSRSSTTAEVAGPGRAPAALPSSTGGRAVSRRRSPSRPAGTTTSPRSSRRASSSPRAPGPKLSTPRAGADTSSPPRPMRRAIDAGLLATLADRGYEPAVDADAVIRLRNCPFDRLGDGPSRADLLAEPGACSRPSPRTSTAPALTARADPVDGFCCVAFDAGETLASPQPESSGTLGR